MDFIFHFKNTMTINAADHNPCHEGVVSQFLFFFSPRNTFSTILPSLSGGLWSSEPLLCMSNKSANVALANFCAEPIFNYVDPFADPYNYKHCNKPTKRSRKCLCNILRNESMMLFN